MKKQMTTDIIMTTEELENNFDNRRMRQCGGNSPLRRKIILGYGDLTDAGKVKYQLKGAKAIKIEHIKTSSLPVYGGTSSSAYESAGFVLFYIDENNWHVLKDITRGLGENLDMSC